MDFWRKGYTLSRGRCLTRWLVRLFDPGAEAGTDPIVIGNSHDQFCFN